MSKKRKIYVFAAWLLTLTVAVFIFAMSSASADESQELSDSLLFKIMELLHISFSSHFIRKAAHFSEFAALSFTLSNAVFSTWDKKYAPVIAFPVACLYAVTDEFHQLFSDGRACQVRDMLIDSSGALLGAFLYAVIILIYIKHIERKKENGSIKTL